MQIAVIGAGVIGLSCARELVREGAQVTVIDAGSLAGAATPPSAGWICPALAAPLAGPGLPSAIAGQIAHGRAAFGIRPSPPGQLVSWLWRFARSGTAAQERAGTRALVELARDSVAAYEDLAAATGLDLQRKGLVLAARERRSLDGAAAMLASVRASGYPGDFDILDRAAALALDPALAPDVAGAVHAREEVHLRPEELTEVLGRELDGRCRRVAAHVRGIDRIGGGGGAAGRWEVRTGSETITADRVVVAAGVWSRRLLADLGVRVPLLGGVGHTVTAEGTGTLPSHPMKLVEANTAIAPFGTRLRVAARFELAGPGDRASARSVRAALRSIRPYLRDWAPTGSRVVSEGLRPATPDSLPLIGAVPGADGVFAATGHGMLGLTLAPGTARALAPLVLGAPAPEVLDPFSLDRFSRGGNRARPATATGRR